MSLPATAPRRPRHRLSTRQLTGSVIAAAVATIAVLGGCAAGGIGGSSTLSPSASQTPAPNPDQPALATAALSAARRPVAKVAMLLPLTAKGQAADVAKGMRQAAELALFEANNPGFQLVFKDTQGTPDGAKAAMTLAASEGVELVLGPLYGQNVQAVAPLARQMGVPVIAFSNDRRTAGNGTYLLSFQVNEEVERIISFAARQGKRRFAALVPDNDYGKLTEQAFRNATARAGGQVVALERYAPSANGMLEPSQRLFELAKNSELSGAGIDAIFLPGGPETLPSMGPLVKYASLDTSKVKFLGSGSWDYPNIGREAAFHGGWYPAPDPRAWQSFSEKFSRTYGSSPPRIATLAYDAVTIAVSLAAYHPKGQRYTPANLTRPNGFSGLDGALRFTSTGTAERGLAILEVQQFGARVADPAPVTFSAKPTAATQPRTASYTFPGFPTTDQ